jgi:hypothetical protein
MSKGYIEIVGSVAAWSIDLTFWDRCMIGLTFWDTCMIGKFTRENVELWLFKLASPDAGFCPVDFHAVWGDIDIPWATKEGRDCYQRTHALTAQKTG